MKRFFYILFILFFILTMQLIAQYTYSFPEYMEKLQRDFPRKSVDWFAKNAYSDTYNVSKNIFIFYRGISKYYSYIKYWGSTNELLSALSDFRQSLDIPYDVTYNFNNRALLYIAGILTVQSNNIELASLIFKEYSDNSISYDNNYPTAIYWSLYHGYLDNSTYSMYYQRLKDIEANEIYPSRIIFDYFTGEYMTINQMLKNLYYPEKYIQKSYKYFSPQTDVYQAVKRYINILPEDSNSLKYGTFQHVYFKEYPPKNINNMLYGRKNRNSLSSNKDRNINKYSKTKSSFKQKKIEDSSCSLTILINTIPIYGDVIISINGTNFHTRYSKTFSVKVSEGKHPVIISFLGNSYTNIVNVTNNAYNLLSIIIQRDGIQTSMINFDYNYKNNFLAQAYY